MSNFTNYASRKKMTNGFKGLNVRLSEGRLEHNHFSMVLKMKVKKLAREY